MKWLGFIILVLIESLAIFGLSLEQIGFTIPQAILISFYVVLLIITITGFIITHFVNLQNERENEFRILIRELREIKEVVGTSETRVIKLESLIENDVRNDIEGNDIEGNEIVRQNLIRKAWLVAKVLSPLLFLLSLLSEFPILGK